MIPGTTIEVSSAGALKVREGLRRQCGGCCSVLFLCLLMPLIVATGIFAVILVIAFVAFSIQALVVGGDTINDPALTECKFISQWLLVFGSLTVGGCFLSCLTECIRSRVEKPSQLTSCCLFLPKLVHLVTFGWVCCGLAITYNPGSYPLCSPSLYSTFQVMVNFLFWGTVALIVAVIVLTCLLAPIFLMYRAPDKKNEEKTPEEQQNLLEKA